MKYLMSLFSYGTLKAGRPNLSTKMIGNGLSREIGGKEPVLSLFLRRSEHYYLLEAISSMKLGRAYKSYLTALILKHEKNYQKAWYEVKDVDDESLIAFKIKLLYDMKKISHLIEYSNEGVDVLSLLNEEQKINLIGYLTARDHYNEAEKMVDITAANKDVLYQIIEDERKHVFFKYNWSSYKRSILEEEEDVLPEEIVKWKEKIDFHDDQFKSLGYILFINNFYSKDSFIDGLNQYFVPYLKKRKELYQYIELEALHYLNFEIDGNNKKGIELQNMLNYFLTEQNPKHTIIKSIVKLIPKVNLNQQHIMSIRRLILDEKIELESEYFIDLFKRDRRLHSIFHYPPLFVTPELNEKIDEYIFNHLSVKTRKKIYKQMTRQLIHTKSKMHLPRHFVRYLEQTHSIKLTSALILARYYYRMDEEAKADAVIQVRNRDKQLKMRLYLTKYLYYQKEFPWALKETQKMALLKPEHPDVIRNFIRIHHIMGDISQRYEYIQQMRKYHPNKLYKNEYDMARQEYELYHSAWQVPAVIKERAERITYEIDPEKIMFVLNKAMPALNGYTVRSHEMIKRVKSRGYDPFIATRLGWSPTHDGFDKPDGVYDGIKTYYIDRSNEYMTNKTPLGVYFDAYAEEMASLVEKEKPAYIHAASNFQNALPALQVGKAYGIKTIYEVRGLWHYTQSAKNGFFYQSERFDMQDKYEMVCCNIADEVICISESLKEHLIGQGISSDKITVIPNGVDASILKPMSPALDIIERYQLKDKYVLGFVGSLTSYEGIDIIFESIKMINESHVLDKEIIFIVVGDGQHKEELVKISRELGIEESVIFTGRVTREEVNKFYSVIDVAPFPRKDEPVCHLVTPIKTYEAMAMGKKVIVSNVGALREMVYDGFNGLVVEAENHVDLQNAIVKILKNDQIGPSARQWVVEHREWKVLMDKLVPLYDVAG